MSNKTDHPIGWMRQTTNSLAVIIAILAMAIVLTASSMNGVLSVEVEAESSLSYFEKYGENPLNMELNADVSDIVVSKQSIKFRERFDSATHEWDGDGDAGDDHKWFHNEASCAGASSSDLVNTDGTWSSSKLNYTAQGELGVNFTCSRYYTSPNSDNGLLPSGGVHVFFRFRETSGSGYFNWTYTDDTYVAGLGLDGSNDLDVVYHNAADTLVSTKLFDVVQDTWYVAQMTFTGTSLTVYIYDDEMAPLNNLAAVTTKLNYATSTFTEFRIQAASNAQADESIQQDWLYTLAEDDSASPTIEDRDSADMTEDHSPQATSEANYEQVKFSHSDLAVDNTSSTTGWRSFVDTTNTFESTTSDTTQNKTEFGDAIATVDEGDYDASTLLEQEYYGVGFTSVSDSVETYIGDYVEDKLDLDWSVGDDNLVDYYINELDVNITLAGSLQLQVEEYMNKDGISILAYHGAHVVMTDGTEIDLAEYFDTEDDDSGVTDSSFMGYPVINQALWGMGNTDGHEWKNVDEVKFPSGGTSGSQGGQTSSKAASKSIFSGLKKNVLGFGAIFNDKPGNPVKAVGGLLDSIIPDKSVAMDDWNIGLTSFFQGMNLGGLSKLSGALPDWMVSNAGKAISTALSIGGFFKKVFDKVKIILFIVFVVALLVISAVLIRRAKEGGRKQGKKG